MSDMDWFGLMRGITEMHVKSIKFAGERADSPTSALPNLSSTAMTSPAIQVLPDSSVSGNEGSRHGVQGEPATEASVSAVSETPAAQTFTPLYLLSSEIVDLVELERKNR